ncbi:MAG: NAD(P)-binding domain-containing protein [Planctomycetes bacterium]|nr:NAD(P)-binding domain-containing protein [Planctomycetota bacterium]
MTDPHSLLLPAALAAGLAAALGAALLRRGQLRVSLHGVAERRDARVRGSHAARLQHPVIDLDRCIGCGSCVTACPEEGVLALVHGQATVVHGSRCVGHGRCADACPVGAVAVTLGDLSDRRDLPALQSDLEAVGVPGLFVAGELSGHALVRTAVNHGITVADAVHARLRQGAGAVRSRRQLQTVPARAPDRDDRAAPVELLIVGAGPAGLAAALRARELGIEAVVLEQADRPGGAVAAYPRGKLVMTQPMVLPLHGRLGRLEYSKEELVELWDGLVAEHALDVRTGVQLTAVSRRPDGTFVASTSAGTFDAQHLCLALGRRGTPRKLGIPGEELPKVHYALQDAGCHRGERVLVVGGGDSAIEAALGLAAQPDNHVTLSYRRAAFNRLKARNDRAIREAEATGSVDVRYRTTPVRIGSDRVVLRSTVADGPADERDIVLPNDAVFVLAGGTPPFGMLEQAGVSFDPADRPATATEPPGVELAGGLVLALGASLALAGGVLLVSLLHGDYYALDATARDRHPDHALLRPTGTLGLPCGLLAVGLMLCNLTYLLRRARTIGRRLPGSLRAWMNAHVVTGLTSFLAAALHAGFAPADTVGGHAFLAFAVVVVTGTIGRYLYAFVPRAANGAVLGIEEIASRIDGLTSEWKRTDDDFAAHVRARFEALVDDDRRTWGRGFVTRLWSAMRRRIAFSRALRRLHRAGLAEGIPASQVRAMLDLARRAHDLQLAAVHYEELGAILSTWRFLHRWLALLLVLLTVLHVVAAWRYANVDWSGLPGAAWFGGGR